MSRFGIPTGKTGMNINTSSLAQEVTQIIGHNTHTLYVATVVAALFRTFLQDWTVQAPLNIFSRFSPLPVLQLISLDVSWFGSPCRTTIKIKISFFFLVPGFLAGSLSLRVDQDVSLNDMFLLRKQIKTVTGVLSSATGASPISVVGLQPIL